MPSIVVDDRELYVGYIVRDSESVDGASYAVVRFSGIVSFHDETLEVIGDSVEFIGTVVARSASEAISTVRGTRHA
jgi:hypothetical protein